MNYIEHKKTIIIYSVFVCVYVCMSVEIITIITFLFLFVCFSFVFTFIYVKCAVRYDMETILIYWKVAYRLKRYHPISIVALNSGSL
jgi:hypothetical protein